MDGRQRCFEAEWPPLARDLKAWLTRRGVSHCLTEDIVQETGVRLFRMWDEVDFQRSPRGLAFTIARNLVADEARARRNQQLSDAVPDRAAADDVEAVGIARLELHRVGTALQRMSPSHRSVLLAELGDVPRPEGSAAAVKMMRMRARRRLNELLQTAPASAFVVGFRRVAARVSDVARRGPLPIDAPAAALAAVCGSVAVIVAVTGTGWPTPARSAEVASVADPSAAADHDRLSRLAARARLVETRRDMQQGTTPRRREPKRVVRSYAVEIAEDEVPVKGRAVVRSRPDDDNIDLPECWAEPAGNEVYVGCRVDTGSEKHEAKARLRIDDLP